MTIEELEAVMIRARYKVLVGMRPLGPARETYNLVIAELTQEIRQRLGDTYADGFRDKTELSSQEDKWRHKTI